MEYKKGLGALGMRLYSLAAASFEKRNTLLCPSPCIQIGKENALNSQIGDVCLTAPGSMGRMCSGHVIDFLPPFEQILDFF